MPNPYPTPSLYDEIVAAGIPHDHHQSDLYVPATKEAAALIKARRSHGEVHHVQGFIDNVTGKPWLDVMFAYDPFWEARVLDPGKVL